MFARHPSLFRSGGSVKTRAVVAGLLGAATVAAGGTVASAVGTTFAAYTQTVASSPGTLGAARVTLGDDGAGPQLGYEGLRPGASQTVALTVDYRGTIAADVSLTVAPNSDSTLCERTSAGWRARAGVPLLLSAGDGAPVSYCSLYAGARLPLATAAAPDTVVTVPVTVTLGSDATAVALGLHQSDVATIHAEGGFTDEAAGSITLSTARPEEAVAGSMSDAPASATLSATLSPSGDGTAVVDSADPAAAAMAAGSTATPVALPPECTASGMRAEDFAEVVAVDARTRSWDAGARRGAGAGPFLVLGTAGADTITGSDRGDCIVGGGGDDVVAGGGGADVLIGGAGVDTLSGGAADDRLYGGPGTDVLDGGEGADTLEGGSAGATCVVDSVDRSRDCAAPVAATSATTAPTIAAPSTPVAPVPAVPAAPAAPSAAPAAPSPPLTVNPTPTPGPAPAASAPSTSSSAAMIAPDDASAAPTG
ncbi:hypothetical protein ACQP04_32975 [Pseudonocardia halophobica]|uniref:calcium-binding protein n=1 Tax=Pseudonocardia halophobica TaxID=29401 RepID=UPI003D8A69F5